VLVEERRQRVLDLVRKRGFVALVELFSAVEASESTIRRDIEYWQREGVLKKTHGGAVYTGNGAGLPTLEVARLLVGRAVQVVTNSLPIASLFANRHEADLVLLGGYVFPRTGVALGPWTVRMMEDIHVQQAVLSVGGITDKGLFNSNLLLVETERQMMRCADEVVVVADHTKIGRPALAFLCDLATIDTLIVDSDLGDEQRALLDQTDVRVLIAQTPSPSLGEGVGG